MKQQIDLVNFEPSEAFNNFPEKLAQYYFFALTYEISTSLCDIRKKNVKIIQCLHVAAIEYS